MSNHYQYKVISGTGNGFTDAVASLNLKIETLMDDGWYPVGAPFVSTYPTSTGSCVMQAMGKAPELRSLPLL